LRRVGTDQCLFLVFDRQDAIADGQAIDGQRHDPARAFARDDFKVIGLSANDHADGDIALIIAALVSKRDGRRNFQGARHGDHFGFVPRGLDRGLGPLDQLIVEVVVKTGFDNQEFCHAILLHADRLFAEDVQAIAFDGHDVAM
jgi:hypothetical protein